MLFEDRLVHRVDRHAGDWGQMQDVDELSDGTISADGGQCDADKLTEPPRPPLSCAARQKRQKVDDVDRFHQAQSRLLEVTKSNCRCKANCVKPFRDPATLTAVRAERLKLLQMEKQAADREAGQSQGHFIRAGCCEVVVCTGAETSARFQASGLK